MALRACLIGLLATGLLEVPTALARQWTDNTGKNRVEAEFLGFKDGKVRLRKEDGAMISVPIERLSEADQRFVRAQSGGKAALAQDGARAIVEKAIQAQGGEAMVAKLRTMRMKAEGTTDMVPGQPNLPITIEDTWQMPNQYKAESSVQLRGRKLKETIVIDGDKGWIQMDGQVRDMPKEALAQKKKWKFAKDLDRLGFLGDAGIALSVLDEINVEGKSAVGVLVKAQGQPDTQLYFDKTTGLLVKRVQRVLDPSSGKELQGEVIYSDYQEKDGLKHYGKTAAFIDGKKVIDARVTEVEFFEKLDPKVFARP